MSEVCRKCLYSIYLLNGVWVDAFDEDECCYDENLNLIGDGLHYPEKLSKKRMRPQIKCNCRCHTNPHVRHVAACCCEHQYVVDCPHERCSRNYEDLYDALESK